jgi:hypothetical protein
MGYFFSDFRVVYLCIYFRRNIRWRKWKVYLIKKMDNNLFSCDKRLQNKFVKRFPDLKDWYEIITWFSKHLKHANQQVGANNFSALCAKKYLQQHIIMLLIQGKKQNYSIKSNDIAKSFYLIKIFSHSFVNISEYLCRSIAKL